MITPHHQLFGYSNSCFFLSLRFSMLASLNPRTIYDWEHDRRISDASREAIERALAPYEKHTTQ